MRNKNKKLSLFSKISFAIFLIILPLYIGSRLSVPFADFVNGTIARWYRVGFGKLTSSVPFSLFEVVIASVPILFTLVIITAVCRVKRREGRIRLLVNLTAIALLLWSGNALALGVAYNATPISERLSIERIEINEDNLTQSLIMLRDEVNELAPIVDVDGTLGMDSVYTMQEISNKICVSYEKIAAEYGYPYTFTTNAKAVRFSNIMSYFSITGIYTFYTGEANVNVAYPDYDVIFTAAHELSHQRGVLRENEANFMAYLVNARSDDPYLRYSAALTMLEHISSALYRTNADAYREIISELSDTAKADILSSYAVSEKYGDTFISDISRFVNDLFLKSNGTPGIVSYGMVVELAVSYFYETGRISENDK